MLYLIARFTKLTNQIRLINSINNEVRSQWKVAVVKSYISIIQSRDEAELLYIQYNRGECCEQAVK